MNKWTWACCSVWLISFSANAAAEVLTPAQAAKKSGQAVTVEFQVQGSGKNPAGFVELYSEKTWQHPDCFFIRFPETTQKILRRWDIADVGKYYQGEVIRVTGKVEVLTFPQGPRPAVVIDDWSQIELATKGQSFPLADVYKRQSVAGFRVLIHPDVLAHEKEAAETLQELENQLRNVRRVVPAEVLPQLLRLRIWIEWEKKKKGAAEFHVSAKWLKSNGYNPDKVGTMEINNARNFVLWSRRAQPWMVLHDLAHGYHHLVLGVDHAEVRKAYHQAKERKLYDTVAYVHGGKRKAYALTNPQEYFAELSEAYFGKNDFFPFTRAELEKHDPVGFQMMEKTWLKKEW